MIHVAYSVRRLLSQLIRTLFFTIFVSSSSHVELWPREVMVT